MAKAELGGPERAHLNFCFALHRVVAARGADSCFSPYSVASALGLVSQAARGSTADELLALLTGGDPDIAKQAELLREASVLSARHDPVLAVSNTLWAWEDLPLKEDFRDVVAGWPGGTVATAPFVTDPERARRLINEDVAATTRDLIPELLLPGAVDPDTVASIVNALYLKVAWSHAFREGATEDADFHSPSGTRRVPTMRQSESLGYAAHAGWQLVELPAAGGAVATVLLPDGELAASESDMDTELLSELLSAKRTKQVRLSLPRFKLDVRSPLTTALKTLGLRTMFTQGADLGGLTDDPRVLVSDVLHQAVLRVDERGLEGAAATAAMMRLTSITIAEPVTVDVDRPFLLLVRHAGTGVVYFFARVVEP